MASKIEDELAYGTPHRAVDEAVAQLEAARHRDDPGAVVEAAAWLAWARTAVGDLAGALHALDEGFGLGEAAGGVGASWLGRSLAGWLRAHLGSYDEGCAEAEAVLRSAEPDADGWAITYALRTFAEAAARRGEVAEALRRWDDAIGRLRRRSEPLAVRLAAEVQLDAAEALLDREGASDGSEAAARLSEARTLVGDGPTDLGLPLRMMLARARAGAGDEDGALGELDAVIEAAACQRLSDVEWRARWASAAIHARRGAELIARRHELAATEVLESIVTALPVPLREPFWNDPRRREARRRASARSDHGAGGGSGRWRLTETGQVTFHRPGLERRTARLLDILKRLAGEHDVERLVERITDAAIELAGAERGFVLLLDEEGKLDPWLVRDAGAEEGDPSVAFSRSIAEAVLIDGEPIVTVDARDDHRLSEYLSVHKLMLQSVACLPIRGRGRPVGVLYLEHRMRRGRFHEDDFDLLVAFADQAAIALENARLLTENERRRVELEETNRELAAAKAEIERVLIARTAELEETRQELDRTRDELRGDYERHGIVGRSEAMRKVFAVVDRVRQTDVPVVIQGESGTGKELIARAVHYGGLRAKRQFVAVNCAAIPEALLESELFGHVRGAFTGADRDRRGLLSQASGGTLFLDEIGDMPAKMQVELLRVLQDGRVTPVGGNDAEPVDVRIICASNKALRDLVRRGQFREDLYYRLDVVEIRLPSLHERPEDVPLLCHHFLREIAHRERSVPKRLTREAIERLASHPLPGNVRQLEHVLLNACVMVEGENIEASDLALGEESAANDRLGAERARAATASWEGNGLPDRTPAQSLGDYKATEKQRILAALEEHAWNRARAASALGMPRRTFYRRLREHGILDADGG